MKIIVAHPAQQHSYRLATALKKAGLLDRYITTVYYKRRSFTYWCAKLLRGNLKLKARGRRCDFLKNEEVLQFCELSGLAKLLCMHVSFLKSFYETVKNYTADRFAKKVAKYAMKHQVDAVITYDDSSPLLFEILKKKAPHIVRILDMSSGSIPYLLEICKQDCIKAPSFAPRLRRERASFWDKRILKRSQREIDTSNYFLVPSEFVGRSLQMCGSKPSQFLKIPYGVDISAFSQKKYTKITNRPLRCIYVGGVKELKGMYYLLEAFKRIPREKATLTVVGAADTQAEDLKPYLDYVKFTGPVLHDQVHTLLQQSDVFVFPSLVEGFSLSCMEAAACGLPLIISENTGFKDVITAGKEAFVIPIQSIDAIVEKVNWFIEHPNQIELMGRAARQLAEKYTWEAYYERAGKIIKEAVEK